MGNDTSQNVIYGDKINNDVELQWKKVGSPFPSVGREGQSACSVVGSRVYVFGGVLPGGEEVVESNDLFMFDADKLVWEKVKTRGTQPPARCAASLIGVDNKLYLFGGLSQNFGWYDDLFVLDTVSNTWSVITGDGKRPCPRDKLQATVVDKSIYYFGGFGPKSADEDILEEEEDEEGAEFGWFDDLYVFNTETKKWSEPMMMNLGVPTARAAHGMCTVGRNIVIFGGRDMERRRNDIHMFNVDTRKWNTELKPKGREPEPRSFHTATGVNNRVVVMGGRGIENQHFADVHIFDTETGEWLQPNITGDLPTGRGQHSAVLAGDRMVLFGGSGAFNADIMQCTTFHTDTYILNKDDILKGSSTSTTTTTSN